MPSLLWHCRLDVSKSIGSVNDFYTNSLKGLSLKELWETRSNCVEVDQLHKKQMDVLLFGSVRRTQEVLLSFGRVMGKCMGNRKLTSLSSCVEECIQISTTFLHRRQRTDGNPTLVGRWVNHSEAGYHWDHILVARGRHLGPTLNTPSVLYR